MSEFELLAETEATDEEIAAVDDEIEFWAEFLHFRSEASGPACALSALWTLADMMKEQVLPKAN